ncbi:gluconokinase [Streptomyces sp. NPDC029526]|uniref:gluconokinase n=1 Tax=Streptomyces sp. NPDC029526 TaxID=3155728 RepID=UPI0033DC7B45
MSGNRVVVVMGVTGTGKTTIGVLLASRFGVPFAEGDDFHSRANIAKMSGGTPLTDADRGPWLDTIGEWARDRTESGGMISGSALRRAYRDRVRATAPDIVFVHLTGDREVIEERLARRQGHFMPTKLLASQIAELQPLEPDEKGVTVDVSGTPEEIADRVVESLRELDADAFAP